MRLAGAVLLFFSFVFPGQPQDKATPSVPPVGLEAGQKAPPFRLVDQFGREQSNETLRAAHGTVLLFFRSADWWPFCKAQLVQLQNAKQRFAEKGIALAAISYDSPAILKEFASRQHIDFPLLADADSAVIGRFGVLNKEAKGMTRGMAHPGFFYIDESGFIHEKYFEAKYTDRFTPNNVIAKLFPELTEEVRQNVEAPHLRLTLAQSDRVVVPGSRVTLTVDIELAPGVHVYAPGVSGYKPIELLLRPEPGIEPSVAMYPASQTLYLEAIREQVPVFEGKLRITQDVTVSASKTSEAARSLVRVGGNISLAGELKYQACDQSVCYPPTVVPVSWELQVRPLDLQRSPAAIRHKER